MMRKKHRKKVFKFLDASSSSAQAILDIINIDPNSAKNAEILLGRIYGRRAHNVTRLPARGE